MTQLPTLRQLEYVVALADHGTFVEAARRCGVSQPALSKQVREVEELLGVDLFERARPAALLTPAGVEVVARAREVLSSARDLADAAAAASGRAPANVRLGVIPSVAPYGLPGLISKVRARYPRVTIVVHELQTVELLAALRVGAVDVGLLAHPFDGGGLHGADVAFERFVFAAPAGHPLATEGPIEVAALAGVVLLLMEDGHCLRDQALEVCAAAGSPRNVDVTAASVTTLTRLVEGGLGATLLPESAVPVEVRLDAGIVTRTFVAPSPGRTLTLQWRARSPHEPWLRELAGLLRDHYVPLLDAV